MSSYGLLAAAVAAVLGMATPALAAPPPACVAEEMQAVGFSGVAYAVRGGAPVVSEARGDGITTQTRFNVGSLNKMFTAVAVAQLVDAGKARFEDPVGRRLPGLPPSLAAVTLHQLLTHTSGAGNYFVPQNRAAIRAARTATDLVPLVAAQPLEFEPGTKMAYSNSGYVLLGALVERLSGKSYAEYMQEKVFAPGGMTATSLEAGPDTAVAMTRMNPATGSEGGDLRPSPMSGGFGSPAGGAYSTAGDLARFAEALLANRLTRADTTRLLITPKALPGTGQAGGYGYGFTVAGEGPDRRVGHGGGSAGVNAELAAFPARNLIVAVLANRDPPAATRVARALEAALIGASCPTGA